MRRRTLSILMVSDFYPPHLGGAERVVADLSAELSARGHQVRVATLWHEGLPHRECVEGIEIHRLQSTARTLPFAHAQADRPFHPPIADPWVTRQLRGIIACYRPDVVHGHTWMMCSALPLQPVFGFAAVATLHDYGLLCPKKTLLYHDESLCHYHLSRHCVACVRSQYGLLKGLVTTIGLVAGRRGYSQVDTLIALSSYSAAQHRGDSFFSGRSIVTIPNFVRDYVRHAPIGPKVPGLPDNYMLFVGALGKHKGVEVLLNAFQRLQPSIPLVLIGPPQADTPVSFPPGVIVRPGLEHATIIHAMDHCRFVVFPSIWPEGLPLVPLEAMARGKAVVASEIGGVLDIVQHEITGLLVVPGDVEALAGAMQRLLGDPGKAAALGRSGAARCDTVFNTKTILDSIEHVYRQARQAAQSTEANAPG